MKIKSLIFSIIILLIFKIYPIEEPNDPKDPGDTINSDLDKFEDKNAKKFNIKYMNKKGILKKGIIKNKSGIYFKLSWDENESGLQEILIDFVQAIRIKGYKMDKQKVNNKLSRIFYVPYLYDIEFTDGKIIRNAKGKISFLDKFVVYNSLGKETCYTYFVRYWYEDKNMFHDNHSTNYNENPKVPDPTIVYIEFLNNSDKNE
jgi:hypothetical protein